MAPLLGKTAKDWIIGGHGVRLLLESPWTERALSPVQREKAILLHRGEDLHALPIPAGHPRPKAEGDSPGEPSPFALDLSPYAPFAPCGEEGLSDAPRLMETLLHAPAAHLDPPKTAGGVCVSADKAVFPHYYGYRMGDGSIAYAFVQRGGKLAALFCMDADGTHGELTPLEGTRLADTLLHLNTCLMLQYSFASARKGTLLFHASAIRHRGKALLLMGVSGTGKSTHSLLWMRHIPHTDLLNDDNPIVRLDTRGGTPWVYGSPWSGKTPCHRNVKAPLKGLVRLLQAEENHMRRLDPLEAYSSLVTAVPTYPWDAAVMDGMVRTLETLSTGTACHLLSCRPDAEAAWLCHDTFFTP